jgi:hypothetical protein
MLNAQYGRPPDSHHIIGQSDINSGGRNLDSGPYFPVADMIAAVAAQQGYMPAPAGYESVFVPAGYGDAFQPAPVPVNWAPKRATAQITIPAISTGPT